jgi:segregation and condensation protein B
MIENHYKLVLETALLCSDEPLSMNELTRLYGDEVSPENIITWLNELQRDWSEKGMELVNIATGWRFQSRLSMREYLDRLTVEKPPKYSRAVMETLAIIAYRQPVTRGEIEEIRGVTVSTQIIRQLEDRVWIEVIGHKDTIGRPALYATTKQFLDDMSIPNLQSLPSLEDGVIVDQIAQQVINFEGTLLDTANEDLEEQEEQQTQDLALDELNQEELTHDASLKIETTTESSIDEKNKTHD